MDLAVGQLPLEVVEGDIDVVLAQQVRLHGKGDTFDLVGGEVGPVDLLQQARPGGPAKDAVHAVAQEQDLRAAVGRDGEGGGSHRHGAPLPWGDGRRGLRPLHGIDHFYLYNVGGCRFVTLFSKVFATF